jgi:hypothetical protein
MKFTIMALLLIASVSDANAVVYCAAGVYRAGCVARPGVVVHPAVGGAVVVKPVCRWVNGVRVCR